jgi:hypothetical protein
MVLLLPKLSVLALLVLCGYLLSTDPDELPKYVTVEPDPVSYDPSHLKDELRELTVFRRGNGLNFMHYSEYHLDAATRIVSQFTESPTNDGSASCNWVDTTRELPKDEFEKLVRELQSLKILEFPKKYSALMADGSHAKLIVRFANSTKITLFDNYFPPRLLKLETALKAACAEGEKRSGKRRYEEPSLRRNRIGLEAPWEQP